MDATTVLTVHDEIDFEEQTNEGCADKEEVEDPVWEENEEVFALAKTDSSSFIEDLQALIPLSHQERVECPDDFWKEEIMKETRPLERWIKRNIQCSALNAKGVAFLPCLLPHPNNIPLPVDDNHDNESPKFHKYLTLEERLHSVAQSSKGKLIPSRPAENHWSRSSSPQIFQHHIDPKNALQNYCQVHAYSRTRLDRTDRRMLANELLEMLENKYPKPASAGSCKSSHLSALLAPPSFSQSWRESLKTYSEIPLQVGRPGFIGESNERTSFHTRSAPISSLGFPLITPPKVSDEGTGSEVKGQRSRNVGTVGKDASGIGLHSPLVVTPCSLPPHHQSTIEVKGNTRRSSKLKRPCLVNKTVH